VFQSSGTYGVLEYWASAAGDASIPISDTEYTVCTATTILAIAGIRGYMEIMSSWVFRFYYTSLALSKKYSKTEKRERYSILIDVMCCNESQFCNDQRIALIVSQQQRGTTRFIYPPASTGNSDRWLREPLAPA